MAPGATNENHVKDLEFSRALHDHENERLNFISKFVSKDKTAYETVVNNYVNYWVGKDPMTENDDDKEARKSNYTNLTNSYYNIATDFYEGDRGGSPPDATPVTATSLDFDDVIYLLSPEGEVTSDERYWNTLDKWVVYERERLEVAQRAREADARERRREKIAKDKGKEAQEAARAAGRSEYEALVARYEAYEAAGGAQRRPSDEGLRKQAEPAARDQPAKAEQVTG